ncbi:MAG: YiiD C-terminal domain-containing protein [Burkholderiales bacterium]|nr:YiiD C-terminal domain-containing protein [Burkholderiales bacterium]
MVFEAIRRQLGRSVPFARLLDIAVDGIDAQQARARLPDRSELTNHVGSVHAGALFTLCESASGAALAGAIAEQIMQVRLLVRDAQIEYLKPARGTVLAGAQLAEDGATLLAALRRDGRVDVAIDVSAQTIANDGRQIVVARASFNWQVRLNPS